MSVSEFIEIKIKEGWISIVLFQWVFEQYLLLRNLKNFMKFNGENCKRVSFLLQNESFFDGFKWKII